MKKTLYAFTYYMIVMINSQNALASSGENLTPSEEAPQSLLAPAAIVGEGRENCGVLYSPYDGSVQQEKIHKAVTYALGYLQDDEDGCVSGKGINDLSPEVKNILKDKRFLYDRIHVDPFIGATYDGKVNITTMIKSEILSRCHEDSSKTIGEVVRKISEYLNRKYVNPHYK